MYSCDSLVYRYERTTNFDRDKYYLVFLYGDINFAGFKP